MKTFTREEAIEIADGFVSDLEDFVIEAMLRHGGNHSNVNTRLNAMYLKLVNLLVDGNYTLAEEDKERLRDEHHRP